MDLKKISASFREAALWSATYGELDDEYTIFDFSEYVQNEIEQIIKEVYALCNEEQKQYVIANPDQFGHSLCLSMSSHGAGLFDLEPCMLDLDEKLDNVNFWRFESAYQQYDEIHIDFFKYGA